MMLVDNHVFKGMKRDNYPARQEGEFLWDALNVRLTNRDNDSQLAITNERGTRDTEVTFTGDYVGHCVLGKYLTVFTVEGDTTRIYRVTKDSEGKFTKIILFLGELNLDKEHPLEILGDAETELVNKLYWTDGINQPRVINITAPELKLPEDVYKKVMVNNLNFSNLEDRADRDVQLDLLEWYYKEQTGKDWENGIDSPGVTYRLFTETSFDFILTLTLLEKVYIEKVDTYGEFNSGVIQYAFTYFNKYGLESNIFYTSPLHYITKTDRAGDPEEKINNAFKISIYGLDHFDYIRIYSIHRTSLDAVPTVKIVLDIDIRSAAIRSANTVSYIDTGIVGSIEDPAKLLYVGGLSILVGTLAAKDGTLFYGNLTVLKNTLDLLLYFNDKDLFEFDNDVFYNFQEPKNSDNPHYPYNPAFERGYFKAGEYYRCGLQFQFKTGEWSEPIPLNKVLKGEEDENLYLDIVLNNEYPWQNNCFRTGAVVFRHTLIRGLTEAGVRKVRTCVVYPRPAERTIVCQGVINPTVYRIKWRNLNNPYAASSWFFRPTKSVDTYFGEEERDWNKGADVLDKHNYTLFSGPNRSAEVMVMAESYSNEPVNSLIKDLTVSGIKSKWSVFAVDSNIVTMHSPEIEYGSDIPNTDLAGVDMSIVGAAKLHGLSTGMDLSVESTAGGDGFHKPVVAYPVLEVSDGRNGGLVSSTCYNDLIIGKGIGDDQEYEGRKGNEEWLVYPWQANGSINNDVARTGQTAKLKRKIIANLKYFDSSPIKMTALEATGYTITTPKLFMSNEVTGVEIDVPYLNSKALYFGNIDDLVGANDPYKNWYENGKLFKAEGTYNDGNKTGSATMKYKSSPHLVFSLYSDGKIATIPKFSSEGTEPKEEDWTIPNWSQLNTEYDYPEITQFGTNVVYGLDLKNGEWYIEDSSVPSKSQVGRYILFNIGRGAFALAKGVNSSAVADGQPIGYRWKLVAVRSGIFIIKKGAWIWHQYIDGEYRSKFNVPSIRDSGLFKNIADGMFEYTGNKYVTVQFNMTLDPSFVWPASGLYYLKELSCKDMQDIEDETNESAQTVVTYPMQALPDDTDTKAATLPIVELKRTIAPEVRFGGTTDIAIRDNMWVPSSEPIDITNPMLALVSIPYQYGDTWYTRYDCVKTYPFTNEDPNQIIEVGSFMLETHINLDGRYDSKRGSIGNLEIRPDSYKINDVYSQSNNFFNCRTLDEDFYKTDKFPYLITWSLTKLPGMDVDPWTNITMANTMDLDSSKGAVTALKVFNDNIFCFQEKALNQVMFNSRVQIEASDGVPIEIGNSGKVDSTRVLSGTVGCYNKWSIVSTPIGMFFHDRYSRSLYMYGESPVNITDNYGLSLWAKGLDVSEWDTIKGIRSSYDNLNGDVYFAPMDNNPALCWSNKLVSFTSFMSYNNTLGMFNFEDEFYTLKQDGNLVKLWENFAGEYNMFFDTPQPFYATYICNDNPTLSKIFDTVELDTLVEDFIDGEFKYSYDIPFTSIMANNDYQEALYDLLLEKRLIRKKFNVWRINIPRASFRRGNSVIDRKFARARIRNPWTKITLYNDGSKNLRTILYNTATKYSV